MTLSKITPENRNKTFIGSIIPSENWHHFEEIMTHLGHLKRLDYHHNYSTEEKKKNKRKIKGRVQYLQSHGINDVLAKTIINDNDSLFSLAMRTRTANRAEWHKDVAYAKKHPKNKKAQKRSIIAQRNLDKGWFPKITHGGNKIWREAQDDQSKMLDFKNRRKWFGAIGRSDDKTKRYSNQVIRVDEDAQVWVSVPVFYRDKLHLSARNSWLCVGELRMKHGFGNLMEHRKNGKSVTFRVQFLRGKWCLRATLQITPVLKSESSRRLLGIDVNAGHLDYIVLDEHGNPCSRAYTAYYDSRKDVRGVTQRVFKWAGSHGVSTVVAEELGGLQRRVSRGRGGALNRTTSRIPTGLIKRELMGQCESRGWLIDFVDPAFTSKNTVFWCDLVKGDRHQVASYLIGRRGLGLSISERESVRLLEHDSGHVLVNTRTGELCTQPGEIDSLFKDSLPD